MAVHESQSWGAQRRSENARFRHSSEPIKELPEGLTVADWTLEKIRWQNPRIRSLLGCIRLLGGVLESNYAILHCSPERLREIWRKVRQVADLIRKEVAPLMAAESQFEELESARQRTELSLRLLTQTVLSDLDRFPECVPSNHLLEIRKLLCVSIGKLHSFLQDAFGELMANDPRSSHDADYFLSKRFPQDLEEAEWLFSTVTRLQDYLEGLDEGRLRQLTALIEEVRREQSIPTGRRWQEAVDFLQQLLEGLAAKLKEVLALRGIRFYEMEILDRYALEIPIQCRMLQELHGAGREIADQIKSAAPEGRNEREQSVRDLMACHGVVCRRMVHLMTSVDRQLRDLMAFTPIWLDSISNRRALLLKRGSDEVDAGYWD